MRITVVIPALNEEKRVAEAVRSAFDGGSSVDVIVADGGSTDDTIRAAKAAGASIVIAGRAGRGFQMDCGALAATGEALLFLHADTLLPKGWALNVEKALSDENAVGGAFGFSVASVGLKYRVLECLVGIRARTLGLVYGDQAVFVRKKIFRDIGGYMGLPLMEDVDMVGRLRRKGRFCLLQPRAATSPRNWEKQGLVKRSCKNWGILIRYLFGARPEVLYREYYGDKRKSQS